MTPTIGDKIETAQISEPLVATPIDEKTEIDEPTEETRFSKALRKSMVFRNGFPDLSGRSKPPSRLGEALGKDIWYWDGAGDLVKERVYENALIRRPLKAVDGGPNLLVPLYLFESNIRSYSEMEVKARVAQDQLAQLTGIFESCRLSYYKEICHLRELIFSARVQLGRSTENKKVVEQTQLLEKFDFYIRSLDVQFFNLEDFLEPNLQIAMATACKELERSLIHENFLLKDRLLVYEGGLDNADLRLTRLLETVLAGENSVTPVGLLTALFDVINNMPRELQKRTDALNYLREKMKEDPLVKEWMLG